MKTTGNLGSEKMPIIIDQPDTDSNAGSQGNFNILDLVHKPTEFNIPERNFTESIQLEVGDLETEQGHKTLEEDNKKEWSLKYEPDLFQSDKINNFSCSGFRGKENNMKDEPKKCKKKPKKSSPVNIQENFQSEDVNSQEVFVMKQLKPKQNGVKGKKCGNKLKEKINRIKKGFKPIAPYPLLDDQKIVVQSSVQKLMSPQVNPILIVKIEDQRFSENKLKVSEYFDYEKKIEDSEYSLPHSLLIQGKDLESECKEKKNFVVKSKCYKCYNCPFMTLSKDFLNFHLHKRQKCYSNNKIFHCPGCKNVFYSLTPLRVHLVHDHRMLSKELKTVLQSMQEMSFEIEKEKPACLFETNQVPAIGRDVFSANVEMPLNNTSERDELDKNFSGVTERQLPSGRVLESCGSSKRPTMLETYLDDINNKEECNLPPSLNHNASALLENTFKNEQFESEQLVNEKNKLVIIVELNGKFYYLFIFYWKNILSFVPMDGPIPTAKFDDCREHGVTTQEIQTTIQKEIYPLTCGRIAGKGGRKGFTAPVSDQLPSIQPPPAHSSSNAIMDQSHLMVEHQNHGFIGMANVFDSRDQSAFKPNDSSHYSDEANMMLTNGNYLPSHIQDIPVINLEENNLEKPSSGNILGHEINIEDFSAYHESDPVSLETEENDCSMPVEDEDQEEKKKLKKLGVGFRCDINGCKVRLQSEKNIQYHRRCHEGTLYNCPECCKDCSTWVSLSSHLWQAHKIDMELYKCDQCPYKTPSYSRLTNIHRGIHGKARPFLCDICGKGFKTVKQMRNHKNIHKAKMVRMSACHCEICGRTVADKRQLELHINNTHKKKKPYLCYMCGYASAVKHSLVVHMRRHTGEKPYECEKCEYKTADHNALRRHKMKHSGVRSYKCNHCSYTCIQASTYKVHIKTKHPGLETDIIFSCGQCNFQTLNRGSFLSHTSEHDNFSEQVRKPIGTHNSKSEVPASNEYYGGSNRMDLVGPIISERVVETIVDLSGAQTLLEQDDYYDVERMAGGSDEAQELKFKASGIT